METKLYRVTDAAPSRVCGRRVAAGDVIRLTEPEARYELALGHLVDPDAEAAAPIEPQAEVEGEADAA